jgi:hypothetical protein
MFRLVPPLYTFSQVTSAQSAAQIIGKRTASMIVNTESIALAFKGFKTVFTDA